MWPFPSLVYKHLYSPSSSSTPATCVTSLSKPQNIFLIEFAEQPKSPRMLSHPSTIDLLLNLHPTYIQIIQLPNIALGVQPDSTGELAIFTDISFQRITKAYFRYHVVTSSAASRPCFRRTRSEVISQLSHHSVALFNFLNQE